MKGEHTRKRNPVFTYMLRNFELTAPLEEEDLGVMRCSVETSAQGSAEIKMETGNC